MIGLRWLARSRVRLVVAALLAWCGVIGAAGPIASHVRDQSVSVTSNMLLMTAWFATLLVGSLCLAVLIGDRVFPYRWRERVILGDPVPPPEAVNDLLPPPIVKTHLMSFAIILVVIVSAGGFGLEQLTGGFVGEYQRVGHKLTILRGDNDALKIELIDELADPRREAFVTDALQVLDRAWRDERQPLDVREAALLALGRLSGSLVSSVDSWVREGVKDHWEIAMVRTLRREVAPDVGPLVTGSEPRLATVAAWMLGKLRSEAASDPLLRCAAAVEETDSTVWSACVAGLGLSRDTRALAPLTRLAPRVAGDEATEVLAFATGEIARHYIVGGDDQTDAFFGELVETWAPLATEGSLRRRCAALDVLRKTGDARIAEPLFAIFEAEGADADCPPVHLRIGERADELVVVYEPLRLRVLRALGYIAVGNDEVLDWTRARVAAGGYGLFIDTQLKRLLEMAEAAP